MLVGDEVVRTRPRRGAAKSVRERHNGDKLAECSALTELHDEENLRVVFENLLKLHNVRVPQHEHGLDLSVDA